MITYSCHQCGGQLEIGGAGGFVCPYCGAKSFMSDLDYKGHEEFRKKLLAYYKAQATAKEFDYKQDVLWTPIGIAEYRMANGQPLTIRFMRKYQYGAGCVCYLAQESLVYVFEDDKEEAARFLRGIHQVHFPAADANKLQYCVPSLRTRIPLETGEALLFTRHPNLYPLEMFAPLTSEHLAWVISRMENICCLLEYSNLTAGSFDRTSVFINIATHNGALFGDWRTVTTKTDNGNLMDLRQTALSVAANPNSPVAMGEFLHNQPELSAFDDFHVWNEVIDKGFGGHRFVKYNS